MLLPLSSLPLTRLKPAPLFSAKKKADVPWNPLDRTIQPDLFAPLRPDEQARLRRFAVIGDSGDGKAAQFSILRQLSKIHQKAPFASLLMLGDNLYENGEPKYFEDRIRKPHQDLLDKKVRIFPVMGNHDAKRGYQAQQMTYWGVPPFYNQRMGNLEFFAIDTTILLPGYDHCHESNPLLAEKTGEVQLQWLDKALEDSTAKYKIVFGHYPIYSSGLHAVLKDVTIKLRNMLEPILARHGVSVYLAGHEHHYEKSKIINGIQHFVSGAAGKLRRDTHFKNNPPYPREKLIPRHHLMMFEETDLGLTYQVLSKRGQVLDSGTVQPNQGQQPAIKIKFT